MAITKTWEVNTLERELPETLIPYKDLTESTVLGWVKAALGTEEVARVEKWLEDEIALINTPVTGTGKPW